MRRRVTPALETLERRALLSSAPRSLQGVFDLHYVKHGPARLDELTSVSGQGTLNPIGTVTVAPQVVGETAQRRLDFATGSGTLRVTLTLPRRLPLTHTIPVRYTLSGDPNVIAGLKKSGKASYQVLRDPTPPSDPSSTVVPDRTGVYRLRFLRG